MHMTDLSPTTPPSKEEKRALNNSIGFNIIVAVCIIVLAIGALLSLVDRENGLTGLMMSAVILGPLFLIISFIYNAALISKTTSPSRKIYAITATIITGLLGLSCVLVLIFNSLRH